MSGASASPKGYRSPERVSGHAVGYRLPSAYRDAQEPLFKRGPG